MNQIVFHSLFLLLSIGVQLAGQDAPHPAVTDHFDRRQIFAEVTEIVTEHFFDKQFDVQAWKEHAAGFRQRAINSTTHDQFSDVVKQMLAVLHTSHTYYFSKLDPKRYQLLGVFHQLYEPDREDLFVYEGIGVDTKTIGGKILVSSVYDGLPADTAGIRFGDQILSVDKQPFHPIRSFAGKAQSQVTLQILRSGKPESIVVPVQRLDGRTMFEQALRSSIRVLEEGGKKIGYLHVWCYAGTKYQEIIRATILWGELSQCDALVLDLRDGWGGADVNYLNLFRPPIVNVQSTSRSMKPQNYSGVWGKPVALITNRGSTSGKELFTYGFKKLKLGKVFGEPTAGAVVGGRAFLLENGDLLYLAVADIRIDGHRLEGVGVVPDVQVARPLESAAATDPQLEEAVGFLSRR